MRIFGGRLRAAAAVLAGVIAVGATGLGVPAAAAQPAQARPRVFDARARNTGTGPDGQHRAGPADHTSAAGQCTRSASSTAIKQKGVTYPVSNVISFSATPPFTLTGWAPDVNGTVDSIAFIDGNCADAYLGGKFTSINGTPVRDIAEVDTTTGQVVASFGHAPAPRSRPCSATTAT